MSSLRSTGSRGADADEDLEYDLRGGGGTIETRACKGADDVPEPVGAPVRGTVEDEEGATGKVGNLIEGKIGGRDVGKGEGLEEGTLGGTLEGRDEGKDGEPDETLVLGAIERPDLAVSIGISGISSSISRQKTESASSACFFACSSRLTASIGRGTKVVGTGTRVAEEGAEIEGGR